LVNGEAFAQFDPHNVNVLIRRAFFVIMVLLKSHADRREW